MGSRWLSRALIQFRSSPSKRSTSSWTNNRRNVESDGDLKMWVPRQWFWLLRWRLANLSMPISDPGC
ncbi:MAG: hypothetical protein RLZZ117_1919 [Cyanobacteriota bacterium]